jgi:hypothetical protein
MPKPIAVCVGLLLLAVSSTAQDRTITTLIDRVSEISLKTNLQKIAGPAMEGRMAGSKGDELAIQYIAGWFNTHRLARPYNSPTPYLQSVPLTNVTYRNSSLATDGKQYELDKDWTYFLVDKAGTAINTEVVFIGYGLSAPAYDDLKDIDIEGKLVLQKSGAPKDTSGKPLIPKEQMPDFLARMSTLSGKKPAGMLMFVEDPISEIAESTKDFKTFHPYQDMHTPGFPTLTGAILSKDLAGSILGGNIDSIYKLIAQSGKPHSFNTHKRVSLSIVETDDHRQSSNIIGIIYGTDTSQPGIVITAHHDHEGVANGKTYYGADDNGTGTVALLEIVGILGDEAAKGHRPKRTLVFISTAAEEQGLIGSTWYVANPVLPINKTFCNINIDMIGRVDSFYSGKRPDSNYVYTTYKDLPGNTINWAKMKTIDDACCHLILDTLYNPKNRTPASSGLMGRADNLPFIKQQVPSIWFFGGFHADYHEPGDTWDKINFPLLKQRTQLALATIWQLAND